MYTMWGMHVIHFAFQLRIYTVTRDAKGKVFFEGSPDSAMEKDDHFKLQDKPDDATKIAD